MVLNNTLYHIYWIWWSCSPMDLNGCKLICIVLLCQIAVTPCRNGIPKHQPNNVGMTHNSSFMHINMHYQLTPQPSTYKTIYTCPCSAQCRKGSLHWSYLKQLIKKIPWFFPFLSSRPRIITYLHEKFGGVNFAVAIYLNRFRLEWDPGVCCVSTWPPCSV